MIRTQFLEADLTARMISRIHNRAGSFSTAASVQLSQAALRTAHALRMGRFTVESDRRS